MTTKKKLINGKRSPKGRPKRSAVFVELGLRATPEESELIQEATSKEAERLHTIASRNNFCLRAALMAAKRELGLLGDDFDGSSPGV